MNKDEHIDSIRRQLGVSLAAVSKFNSENKDEISRTYEIYHLKDDGSEKVLTLLFMLSQFKKDGIIDCFCEQNGLNASEDNLKNLVEKHKTRLLTALIYDASLYAMTVNFMNAYGASNSAVSANEVNVSKNTNNVISFPSSGNFNESKTRGRQSTATDAGNITNFFKSKRIVLAFAACFLAIFSFVIFSRSLNNNLGNQYNTRWVQEVDDASDDRLVPALHIDVVHMSTNDSEQKPEIKKLRKQISVNKNDSSLYVNRGKTYTLYGYYDDAINDFDKAIELDSRNTDAFYYRAIANIGKGINDASVINDLETSIILNPEDKAAYYALGVFYYNMYIKDDAKQELLYEKTINALEKANGYNKSEIILDLLEKNKLLIK